MPVNVYKARRSNHAQGRASVDMIGKIVLVLSLLALARAQIPSLGFCPDYVPMTDFDLKRFLGVWYEAERYFQLTEVVSRCVTANYTLSPDGKFRVSNEVTNRFTGIKRVLDGEVKQGASKAEAGKLIVKYTIPLTPETKYSVLETDYDSYAVLWSCSGIGPFHTQNAWIMTRERLAPGSVVQKAYAVLDKYKISKSFFVKTNQNDCAYNTPPVEAAQSEGQQASQESSGKDPEKVRSDIQLDAPQLVVEVEDAKDEKKILENVDTVPERIMEVAEAAKAVLSAEKEVTEEKKSSEALNEKLDEPVKEAEMAA